MRDYVISNHEIVVYNPSALKVDVDIYDDSVFFYIPYQDITLQFKADIITEDDNRSYAIYFSMMYDETESPMVLVSNGLLVLQGILGFELGLSTWNAMIEYLNNLGKDEAPAP
ncbi:MAG: hypothetical protein ACTSRP_02120 [Candidatus Helarchaeota archaeon]